MSRLKLDKVETYLQKHIRDVEAKRQDNQIEVAIRKLTGIHFAFFRVLADKFNCEVYSVRNGKGAYVKLKF